MSDAVWQAAGRAGADPRAGDDATLIGRSLEVPECFGALFDRHAPAINRYIARRLGPDAADDLVAETFLVAFRRRGAYDRTQADARPWLYGIATRLIGRHRRDEVRFFRAIASTGVDPAAEPIADRVTDRIAAQAASRDLAAALARLSQAQRDVLLLVASGLGYEEAALALEVPTGTVSSRLVRASATPDQGDGRRRDDRDHTPVAADRRLDPRRRPRAAAHAAPGRRPGHGDIVISPCR